jgi:hypothetical protein
VHSLPVQPGERDNFAGWKLSRRQNVQNLFADSAGGSNNCNFVACHAFFLPKLYEFDLAPSEEGSKRISIQFSFERSKPYRNSSLIIRQI